MTIRIARSIAVVALILSMAGCHYRLTDAATGAVYYTKELDGQWSFVPGQSVVFTDRTGNTVYLSHPKIETVSKAEYLAGRR